MKSKHKIDVMWEIMSAMNKHSAYWFTAEAFSWELDVDEQLINRNLEQLVEWGLVEHLDLTIEWYRITRRGQQQVHEYRLQRSA